VLVPGVATSAVESSKCRSRSQGSLSAGAVTNNASATTSSNSIAFAKTNASELLQCYPVVSYVCNNSLLTPVLSWYNVNVPPSQSTPAVPPVVSHKAALRCLKDLYGSEKNVLINYVCALHCRWIAVI
jgi:hypothetical protein